MENMVLTYRLKILPSKHAMYAENYVRPNS